MEKGWKMKERDGERYAERDRETGVEIEVRQITRRKTERH